MEIVNRKFHNFIWSLVLCISIVAGAYSPAYADNSTSAFPYYRAGSTLNPYNQQSGVNSADLIGRLLDVSSYNQSMIYNRLLQMSASGADLTTVNSKITSIDSTLAIIKDSLGIGSSLNNVLANQDSNLSHLNTIISQLHYWDNSHGRSYEAGEMIFKIMSGTDLMPDIKTELTTQSAILQSLDDFNKTYNPINYSVVNRINYQNDGSLYTKTGLQVPAWYQSGETFRFRFLNSSNYQSNSIPNMIQGLSVIDNFLVSLLYTPNTSYVFQKYDPNTNALAANYNFSNHVSFSYSILDTLHFYFDQLSLYTGKLQYVMANDDDIAARKANAAQQQTVLTNFTGSGSAAPSVSDFGSVKDSIVDFKAGFSGGASSSDTFSFMSGDSNAWDWFTQETANDLDRTQGSNTRLLRGSSDVAYDTPLLDSYYNSVLSILGGE